MNPTYTHAMEHITRAAEAFLPVVAALDVFATDKAESTPPAELEKALRDAQVNLAIAQRQLAFAEAIYHCTDVESPGPETKPARPPLGPSRN